MKKSILLTVLACTVCVGFIAYGAWTALGFNAEHRSLFSRAGGGADENLDYLARADNYHYLRIYMAHLRQKHGDKAALSTCRE